MNKLAQKDIKRFADLWAKNQDAYDKDDSLKEAKQKYNKLIAGSLSKRSLQDLHSEIENYFYQNSTEELNQKLESYKTFLASFITNDFKILSFSAQQNNVHPNIKYEPKVQDVEKEIKEINYSNKNSGIVSLDSYKKHEQEVTMSAIEYYRIGYDAQ